MTPYFVALVLVCSIALLGKFEQAHFCEEGKKTISSMRFSEAVSLILIMGILIGLFACRWYVGTDFVNYYHRYQLLGSADLATIVGDRDWGFYCLMGILYRIWPGNYVFCNVIIGAIIYIPILLRYRGMSANFALSCFVYITLCIYTWPFNGTRQAVAVAILFFAAPLLCDRKGWGIFCICIFIASIFHVSALMIVPFLLMCRLKPFGKEIVVVCLVITATALLLPGLWSSIISFLESVGQEKMASDYSDLTSARNGVNILRIMVAAVPVLLCFIMRGRLVGKSKNLDLIINMCLMNLVFMLCAYRMTTLARFSQYFVVALPLLIPAIIEALDKKSRPGVTVIVIGLLIAHMAILLPRDSGLVPYSFFF